MKLVDGKLSGADFIPSPNQDDRPAGQEISMIVIHAISLPPGEFGGNGVCDLFTNRLDPDAHPFYREIAHLKVSAHFFIRRDGKIVQFVPAGKRAWHAGVSAWKGREKCNDFSIGIELEGSDSRPFSEAQYEALGNLTAEIKRHYPVEDIVGHSQISPGRKTDPGPHFDWERYLLD